MYPVVKEKRIKLVIDIGFVLAIIFATVSCLMDPGRLKKTGDFMTLLENNSPSDLCPICEVVAPKRSRHCVICKNCVEVFDHHCPWLN